MSRSMFTRFLAPLAFTLGISTAGAGALAAPGVSLRWEACYGDGGVQNRAFACNTNVGIHRLYGSIVAASNITHVIGMEIVVDLATASPVLAEWWEFRNPGTCRLNSLSFEASPALPVVNCPEWNLPRDVGGAINNYQIGLRGPNTARIRAVVAVQASQAVSISAGPELYAFTVGIDRQMTTGAGSCTGCDVPACIVLSSVNLVTAPPGPTQLLSGPANLVDSNYATWQGGGVPDVGGVTGCPAATPARQTTWGAVKSLYH